MQKSVKCSIFPSMSRLCVNLCLFFVLIITSSPYVLKNCLAEYASAQYNWLFFLCLICSAHFFKALVNWGTQILLFTVKTISYLKLNLPWTSLYIRWPTSSATLRTGVCVCGKTFLQVFTSTSLSYLRTFYGNWHFFTVRLETANAFPMLIHLLLEKTLFRLMLLQCPMNTDKRKTKKSNACSYRCLLGCLCLYVFMCAQKHDIRSWLVSIRFAAWNVSVEASLPHSQQSVVWIDQRLWNAFVRHHTQSGDHLIIVFQIDFDAMPHISFIHSIHRNAFGRSFK